ncbi:hypothetical protein ACFS5L_20930 [Streptomyces phyllanthi]|uniref:Uncharacterized protein n=1 Tax=Streptomyces phyllanthi TaxID=1803180 RepID=A0A5N8W9B4_9ACTN|nr:hypothetical protein [Streptomyces phyllanthi]MPY43692.1 hypothetical protein [Streptomyces phyllanthi]
MSAEAVRVLLVSLTLIVVIQFALLVGIAVAVSARLPGTPLRTAVLRGGAAFGGTLTLGLLAAATVKDLLG